MPSGRSLMPRCSTRRPVGGGSTSPDSNGSTTANALSISVLSARERGTSGRQALAAPYLACQAIPARQASPLPALRREGAPRRARSVQPELQLVRASPPPSALTDGGAHAPARLRTRGSLATSPAVRRPRTYDTWVLKYSGPQVPMDSSAGPACDNLTRCRQRLQYPRDYQPGNSYYQPAWWHSSHAAAVESEVDAASRACRSDGR